MNNLAAILLAPLALLWPSLGQRPPVVTKDVQNQAPQSPRPLTGAEAPQSPVRMLQDAVPGTPAWQVRIEQRVIIRISPGTPQARQQVMSALPRRPIRETYQEERVKGCVPISTIVGVEPGPSNRLLLFMSDRRVLTVELDRTCNARDFYSGFYIERNDDGRLCGGRDELQSRAGSSCAVEQLNRLVAVRD